MTELGALVRVENIRTVWKGEEADFTPWLAEAANIAALAEVLGMGPDGLEVVGTEVRLPGANFHADILARETGGADQALVLIENQFGKTDHSHLGKLLTYASGLKARTVVLIGEEIRPEHRATLDWLNTITNEDHNFFACEIELWKIGGSLPAPRFNLVVEPNDWSRERNPVEKGTISSGQERQLNYWAAFAAVLPKYSSRVRPVSPQPANWIVHGLGRTGCQLNATVNFADGWLRGEIYLTGPNAQIFFDQLFATKADIEKSFGESLDWYQEAAKDRRISLKRHFDQIGEETTWPVQHKWLAETLDNLHRVFSDRVKRLEVQRVAGRDI